MQRWWLEPNYDALLVSPDGLAFELRGASVKAITEEDLGWPAASGSGPAKAARRPRNGPTT